MPDMSSLPVSPRDHDRHDALLIAQAAAGDELRADERAQADSLLAACPECRALAADLRAISRAVAAEPAPARPRDFRLAPDAARHARGSWLDRLLGRVSVPQLAILRPLAGSALAIGLLLVVVGTALPAGFRGGTQDVTVSEPGAPLASGAGVVASKAPGVPGPSIAAMQFEGLPAPEATAGAGATEALEAPEAAEPDAPGAAEAMEVGDAAAEPGASPEAGMFRMTDREAAPGAGEDDTSDVAAPAAPEDRQAEGIPAAVPDAEESPAVVTDATAEVLSATAPGGDAAALDERTAVVTLGVLVAIAGALLLALLALARRREDPLLR